MALIVTINGSSRRSSGETLQQKQAPAFDKPLSFTSAQVYCSGIALLISQLQQTTLARPVMRSIVEGRSAVDLPRLRVRAQNIFRDNTNKLLTSSAFAFI